MCNSLLVFHCNYVSRTVSEIFNVKINNDVTLKSELWVVQDHRKWYHSKAWVRFPISHFQSSHDPILYQFRDKARYWSKIAIFFIPLGPSFNAAVGLVLIEWCGYPTIKSLMIRSPTSTQYRSVTDRQQMDRQHTDKRTSCDSIICSMRRLSAHPNPT